MEENEKLQNIGTVNNVKQEDELIKPDLNLTDEPSDLAAEETQGKTESVPQAETESESVPQAEMENESAPEAETESEASAEEVQGEFVPQAEAQSESVLQAENTAETESAAAEEQSESVPETENTAEAESAEDMAQNEGVPHSAKRHSSQIKLPSSIWSIRYKLIGGFLLPVALIVILGVMSYTTASNAVTESFETSAQSTIQKTAEYYDLMFSNIKAVSNDLSNNVVVQEYYSGTYENSNTDEANAYAEIRSIVSSLTTTNKQIKSVYLIARHGRDLYSSTTSLTGSEYSALKDTDEAKKIDAQRSVWISKHEYIDNYSKMSYGVSYARQLLGTSKRGIGYMFFDIDDEYILSALDSVDIGEKSIVAVIAPDGGENVVIKGSDKEDGRVYFTDSDFYRAALDSEEASGSSYVKYNGKTQLFIYSKTASDGFMVCALVPKSVIIAQTNTIQIITITAIVIALIGAIVIGGLMATSMGTVIKKIITNIGMAADGDLTVSIDVNRRDEFKNLADGINDMVSKMKTLINDTKVVSGRVDESAGVVTDSVHTLLNATKEITDAIDGIEKGIVQQADDSESCMRQMDMLSDKINIVSDNSDKIARIAESTRDIVKSGLETIDVLNNNVHDTVDITSEVIEGIETLEDSTKSIGTIINAINDIAEQTNLLSLNASIEAARAGEAGRGFAVVADEIRKLADQSVESVNKIREIVEDITLRTRKTVSTAQRAEDIVAVQEESLRNAVVVFNDIQSQVGELISNLDNITAGIDNIAESKSESITSIQNISAVSQQTAASAEEVTTTADRQMSAVEALARAAEKLSRDAQDLDKAIDMFKVD